MWNKAEDALRKIMDDLGYPYEEKLGEAAFYGPKLDVQVKPAVGNEYTISTCQIDFCLPMKFDLKYIDADGSKKTPVVIHRAILGSLDRFMAFYLEETKGNLPLWMSPKQVNIIPVNNEYHLDYCKEIYDLLNNNDIRVSLDDRDEKLNYKLRESVISKVPYTLIIGDNEKNNNTISYRLRGSKDTITVSKEDFVNMLNENIKNKKYDLE
jgi:threonyl-tRNA synthetase